MPTPFPRRAALGLTVLATTTALATTLAVPAAATSTSAAVATSVQRGVTYVKTLQASDGSFTTSGLSNEWAFSALAAAGTAAVDVVPSGNTGGNARAVYRNQVAASTWPSSAPVVTDYERGILNTYAAGTDPARVSAQRNLLADLASYWQPAAPGYFGPPANFNGTVFGLLALAGARTQSGAARVPQRLLDTVTAVVRANQHDDGGWDFTQAAGNATRLAATSDIDMTGAAMAALCSSGVPATDTAVVAARNFLAGKLVTTTGAFNSAFGANTDSNGWAVSGLNACGIPAQGGTFTTSAGKTPVDFLIAQQLSASGGFRYQPSNTTATAYSSIDALRALAGGGFTAAPPTPTGGAARWVATTSFTSGTATSVALVVDTGATGGLTVCKVPFVPTSTTTTLGAVLDAAAANASPSGCVTGASPTSGTGTITALNGRTNTASSTWKLSIDGSSASTASRGAVVKLGDTVSLAYGS
ncbi:hypothetical protein ACXR2U_01485 [Jatrophihabitans sp. YIM 134969]